MGKKSKAKSAAKAKGGASVASAAASAATGTSGPSGTGGILLTSGGTAGNKKQRCVGCLALLKNLSKAHQCPGCSLLFCWRCEKKAFVSCPNGSDCIHPLRRCIHCSGGDTMVKAANIKGDNNDDFCFKPTTIGNGDLVESGKWVSFETSNFRSFAELAANGGYPGLTVDATPFLGCEGQGCAARACIRCTMDPSNTTLVCCAVCWKTHCEPCAYSAAKHLCDAGNRYGPPASDIEGAIRFAKENGPNAYGKCTGCANTFCYECIDDQYLRAIFVFYAQKKSGKEVEAARPLCGRCYWSAKHCTNPNCANEIGIPTKRCGGCHLDRYCSVECQAAVYPDHIGRCKKIQAKREAAGMDN